MEYFNETEYLVRRKILTLWGAKFHIYNPRSELVAYSKLKAFKLKEDIRIYTGEDQSTELFYIKARNIIDLYATYDVFDSTTDKKIGAWKRRAMKSLIRDEWTVLDPHDHEIGLLQEDDLGMALVRRVVTGLIPQKYNVTINGELAAVFKQNFNPYVMKIKASILRPDIADQRLMLAGSILLCAIERRQWQ